MSSFWKIILIVCMSVIVIAAGLFGYRYYQEYKQPHVPAIIAINPATALFAEIHDPGSWLAGLTHETEWWQALTEVPELKAFNRYALQLDSVLRTDSWISEVLELQKCYISIDRISDSKFDVVFLVELPNGQGKAGIDNFIKKIYGNKLLSREEKFQDVSLTSLLIPELKMELYFAVYKGLFIGSFSKLLVERSIVQLNSGVPVNFDKNFKRIEATAGKNVDANVYINHSSFSQLMALLAGKKNADFVSSMSNLGYWTETDLIIKTDELLFNGYSVTSDGLYLLDNYKTDPQPVTAPDILPGSVLWMLDLGFGDLLKHHAGHRIMLGADSSAYDKFLSDFKLHYNIDLLQEVYPWAGSEIALAEFAGLEAKTVTPLAVFRTKDVLKAAFSLEKITTNMNAVSEKNTFSLNHGEYTIKKLNHPDLLPFLFGPVFSSIRENYFIAIRDYIVFANSPEALIYLIDNFYSRKTLAGDVNYQSFSNNISDNSNIYFYCNLRNVAGNAHRYFNEKVASQISGNKNILQKFEGISLQFSYINQMFYTNLYLKYNPGYKEINPQTWEYELEADLLKKPVLVETHLSEKQNVVVFDEKGQMYLLDHLGNLKWKLPLIETPLSEVFLVDYYRNGKFQYLFNTENYLYLIDLNGNYVADFPAKLAASATGPLNVFDYNNDKEYRIVIPLNDNKIYNFDMNNKPVEGWNKIHSRATVKSAVQHLVVNNKDYLFTKDENGNVIITNRRGEVRVELKKGFKMAANAVFYENKTNDKGLFITTDESGKLVYVSEDGKIQYTEFGRFSPGHFFMYEDFDKDGAPDFIFVDENKIVVFDRLQNELLRQEFSESIPEQPVLFNHMGKVLMGIVLPTVHEIQLFDKNGRVFSGQDIMGSIPFATGRLSPDHKLNLITGFENKVINYLVD